MMTPRERASLVAWAKRKAVPVASCVQASLTPSHLIGDASRDQLAALVIVLAEAIDPGKLQEVTEAADDGLPDRGARRERLRKAHQEARKLRLAGEPVPASLAILDREYERLRKRERAAARREQDAA